jgi:hypothetical protein
MARAVGDDSFAIECDDLRKRGSEWVDERLYNGRYYIQIVRPLASFTCRDNVLTGLAFGKGRTWGAAARADADTLLDRVGLARPR